MNKVKYFIAVFAPVIVMAIWAGNNAYVNAYGNLMELPVTGYDPRDLLSGQYLRYRVNYGKYPICDPKSEQRKWKLCVCLQRVGFEMHSVANWSGDCTNRPHFKCKLWLRGYCLYDQFQANIERYYIPEKYSKSLTVIPPKATIRVRLDGKGKGIVTDFLVKGRPILEYARGNKAADPTSQESTEPNELEMEPPSNNAPKK